MADAAHWNNRYAAVGERSVSWYQQQPRTSLELLDALGVRTGDATLDVGGGASVLVDELVARGHRDVTVLDISDTALGVARARVGDAAQWVCADLASWQPDRAYDVWHDRAFLHFFLDPAPYVRALRAAVAPGGAVVIATFAEDGPTQCSELPVRRWPPSELASLVDDVVEQRRVVHVTPNGYEQPFNWIAGRLA